MSLAADDAGLPDDPEFRAAFVAYVEWGRGPRGTPSPAPRRRRARAPLGLGRRTPVPALMRGRGYSSSTAMANRACTAPGRSQHAGVEAPVRGRVAVGAVPPARLVAR